MPHRQWWPVADHLTLSTTLGVALVKHGNLQQSRLAERRTSARCGKPVQAGSLGMQAAEAFDAGSVSQSFQSTSTKQSEDANLDWQTALLRKLLPNSSLLPLATAGQVESLQPPQHQPSTARTASSHQDGKHTGTASTSPFLYAGVFLDPLSSARLLAWCPPKHSQLSADHLTLLYRPTAEQAASLSLLGTSVELRVVSKAQDSTIQAVAVRCPQWVSQLLQCPAHITVSMADGVKAKTSANLLRRVQQGLMIGVQTEQCHDTITLAGRVGVKLQDGSIAYSASELADKTAAATASEAATVSAPAAAEKSTATMQSAATDNVLAQKCHGLTEHISQSSTASGGVQEQPTARQSLDASAQSASLDPSRPKAAPAAAKLYTSKAHTAHARAGASRQKAPGGRNQPGVPYVQYEELSDEDALEALQELDALLAPVKLTQTGSAHSSARQTGSASLRDSTRRQTSGSRLTSASAHTSTAPANGHTSTAPASAHTSTAGKGSTHALHRGLKPQTGSRIAAQTDLKSTARRLWSASSDIQRASSSSSPVPVPMRILKRPSIASNPCSTSPNFAVSPPLAIHTDAQHAASNAALSDPLSAACNATQTDKPAVASPTAMTGAAAAASTDQQSLHTLSTAPVDVKPSALSTPVVTKTASAAVTSKPDPTSTALSNERLRSQSVLKYLQRQQHSQSSDHSSQRRKSEAPIDPVYSLAADATSALNSQTAQTSIAAASIAEAVTSLRESKSSGLKSLPRITAESLQRLLPSRQTPSWHNPTAEKVPNTVLVSGSSKAGSSTGPMSGPGPARSPSQECNTSSLMAESSAQGSSSPMAGSPQERSSSPVDELVLEMQVQHLMDKVPGLLPAMASFTLKACQGDADQAITLLQQHLPVFAELGPVASVSAASLPSAATPDTAATPIASAAVIATSSTASVPVPSAAISGTCTASTAAHRPPDHSPSDCLQHSPVDLERGAAHRRRPQSSSGQKLAKVGQPSAIPEHSSSSISSSRQSPAELTTVPAQSSFSSKQVLLPAGAPPAKFDTSPGLTASSRHLQSKRVSVSPAAAPAGGLQSDTDRTHTSSGSSDSETDFYDSTGTSHRQPEFAYDGFLLATDPVAAAVDEAGRLVAERTKMKSVADQERQALGLHRQARNTYFAAAQVAFEKGNREAAQELAGKGKEHAQLAKEARHRANQAAYDSCNLSVTNRFKVDLHGLHVEEALQVLEQHLLSLGGLGCPGGVLLQVVTGVGKHSLHGRPKILPAVVRYLSDAGYRFNEAHGNSGILEVYIGGQRRFL